MAWSEQVETTQGLNGERRNDRRYGIQLELRWKLIRRRRVIDTGVGKTIDLSSGGILFDAGRELPAGLNVELAVQWPVRLHNVAALQLIVLGRIVRCANGWCAIRTVQHEFRTVGTATDRGAMVNTARTAPMFNMAPPAAASASANAMRPLSFSKLN